MHKYFHPMYLFFIEDVKKKMLERSNVAVLIEYVK